MDQGLSYLKGKTDIPLQPITLGNLIEENAEKFKDTVIVSAREQKKSFTTTKFLEESDNFAAALYDVGLKRGDKIGIVVNNSVEALIVNFACIKGGFVSVNLNPALQSRELEYFLKTLEISCIICIDKYRNFNILELLKKVIIEIEESESGIIESKNVPSLRCIIVISDILYKGTYNYKTLINTGRNVSKETLKNNQKEISSNDYFTVLFTSGSTGTPKIIGITHYQMANSLRMLKSRLQLKQSSKFCFHLPLFHIFGLGFTIICLFNGVTIVLPSLYYNPEKHLQAISEEKVNYIMGVPTMLADLVKVQREKNLPISPEMAFSGGAAGSIQLYKDILEVLNVKQLKTGYGLTETVALTWPFADHFNDFNSVGTLMDHLEAKIVDTYGNLVPIGTVGELHVKGYSILKNYLYNDIEVLDKDGWFKTGDAVYFDNEGKFYIAGRLKEIINRGGEKVSPGEVEEVLQNHPDVEEVYVVGVSHERLGEEVCACIKLKPTSTINVDSIKNFCKGKLSYYKIPSKIEIMEHFPKTLLGKIQKSKLSDILNKNNHIKI